jgi:hypothetical protein
MINGGFDRGAQLAPPAKALTVQMAALGVVAAYREDRRLDDIETSLVDACRRISLVAAEGRFETTGFMTGPDS